MKSLLIPLLTFAFPYFAIADDLAVVKQEFTNFVKNKESNDPVEILKQFSPEARIVFVQSNGKIEFPSLVSMDRFTQIVTESAKKEKNGDDDFKDVKFTQLDDAVKVEGLVQDSKADFRAPFKMLFKKIEEKFLITDLKTTFFSPVTKISSHDLYAFSVPGDWKHQIVEKVELGDGKRMFPAHASMEGGTMSYIAFESDNEKTADLVLENYPMVIIGPILKKMEAKGAVETGRKIDALKDGEKNRIFYSLEMSPPAGAPVFMSGIVVRTETRIYTILWIGGGGNSREFWQGVGATFEEL